LNGAAADYFYETAGILAIGVLVITYVPWLTLGILQMLGRI